MALNYMRVEGFKGQHFDLDLSGPTLLVGPNGTGKSSVIDGIAYALGGAVPTGRDSAEIAKYFADDGGTVRVGDSSLSWVKRGIRREGGQQKVASILCTSDDDDDSREPNLARWHVSDALLDLRTFLGLSSNKRREFVLRLCGEGSVSERQQIHNAIALRYARAVSGAAASIGTLTDIDQLPDDQQSLMRAWTTRGGVGEVIGSYVAAADLSNVSDVLRRLAKVAGEEKNRARRDAAEARAAANELEAELQGAEATAAMLETRKWEVKEAKADLESIRDDVRQYDAAKERLDRAVAEKKRADERVLQRASDVGDAKRHFERLEALGDEPAEPDLSATDAKIEALEKRVEELAQAKRENKEKCVATTRREGKLAELQRSLDGEQKSIAAIHNEPIGRLESAVRVLRPFVDDPMGQTCYRNLEEITADVAASLHARLDASLAREAEIEGDILDLQDEIERNPTIETLESEAIPLDDARIRAESDLRNARKHRDSMERLYRERHGEWSDLRQVREQHSATIRAKEAVLKEDRSAQERANAELEICQAGEGLSRGLPDPTQAASDLEAAEARLAAAQAAVGRLAAHTEALARAEKRLVDQVAWKNAEAATKAVREVYVVDAVRPLIDEIQTILRAAGRSETVYIDLENARGTPIFDLGWMAEDGSKRSLSALSGGESVLFCAALSIAIARRGEGLRVIMIEADPLDEDNLCALLAALSSVEDRLDACIVATSTPIETAPGWRVVRYGKEVTA